MDVVAEYRKRRKKRLDTRAVEKYRERRNDRLWKRYAEDSNTKIPFGLCQREGIQIGKDWTPRDAWAALEGEGCSASEVYKGLKETGRARKEYATTSNGRKIALSQKIVDALKPEKDKAIFFSGCAEIDENGNVLRGSANVANEWARNNGGVTLNTLLSDKDTDIPEWDFSDPDSVRSWEDASTAYADQASGDVRVIANPPLREGNIFETVELPRLKENKNVTSVTMINPYTNEKTIIFRR